MKCTKFILVLLISTFFAKAQDVVINEYYNSSSPITEWTELIVVKENLDMRGFVLRDNTGNFGNPNDWQGGIEFLYVPDWNNLKAGTVIIINHRGNDGTVPLNSSLYGYVEVGAENTNLFKSYCKSCVGGWNTSALNIDTEGDLLQLLDRNGKNVYTLGHIKDNSSGDFLNITNYRLVRHNNCPEGMSLNVIPGRVIENFSVVNGYDSGNTLTATTTFTTKGTANNLVQDQNLNFAFWRKVRSPVWSNQATLNKIDGKANISFVSSADWDPLNNYFGFMIVRSKADQAYLIDPPKDGTIYKTGDPFYSGIVIDIANLQDNLFIDDGKLDCGVEYNYRIFAYKFNNEPFTNWTPQSGRGRTYDKNYIDLQMTRDFPPNIIIKALNNRIEFCDFDSTLLFSNIDIPKDYQFAWYHDNAVVKDYSSFGVNDSLKVKQTGVYRLDIRNNDGCVTSSNKLKITVVESPKAQIYNSSYDEFTRDTLIELCESQTFTLRGLGGERRKWYKNNSFISESDQYTVSTEGTYYMIASIQDKCNDTTAKITIKYKKYDFSFSQNSLDYILSSTQFSEIKQLILYNKTNSNLVFNSTDVSIIPNGQFTIIQAPPYIIPANGSLTIDIKFQPLAVGIYQNIKLKFVIPCGQEFTVILNGKKTLGDNIVTSSFDQIKFNPMLDCDNTGLDTLLTIANTSNLEVKVFKPIIKAPFSVLPQIDSILKPNSQVIYKIRFNNSPIGIYEDTLKIPIFTNSFFDTLKYYIKGEVKKTDFTISPTNLVLKDISDCITSFDTLVVVTNTSDFDITIDKSGTYLLTDILNAPLILKKGTTDTLRLRIKPTQAGNFNENISLFNLPCAFFKSFQISGNKQGYAVSLSKDTINFGDVYLCNTNLKFDALKLSISGANGQNIFISDIEFNNNNFSLNVNPNDKLSNSNNINVNLVAKNIGLIKDSIVFVISPCNKRITFYIKANVIQADFQKDITLDFGKVYTNTINKIDYIITNNNTSKVVLTNIQSFNGIFTSSLNTFPFEIDSKSSETITFIYSPTKKNYDTLNIKLEYDEPCKVERNIKLIGENDVAPIPTGIIRADIAFNEKQVQGKEIEIPLLFAELNGFSLLTAEPDTLITYISFNPTLLYPKDLKFSDIFKSVNPKLIEFVEKPLGHLKVISSIEKSANITSGEWLRLVALTLQGNQQKTIIKIDSAFIKSKGNVKVTLGNVGEYELIGQCAFNGDRKVQIGEFVNFLTYQDNEYLNISFNSISDDDINLRLIDLYGNEIKIINDKMKSGDYKIKVDLNLISQGFYILNLRQGIINKSIKLIVK